MAPGARKEIFANASLEKTPARMNGKAHSNDNNNWLGMI